MTKLTETQTRILSAAAQRPGNIAMPLPKGLAGAAAKMAVNRMITNGWLEEVDADVRKGEPLWRETGDGHGTTLIATEVGLDAIGIEPVVARDRPKPVSIRAGTKQAEVILLLQRSEGASIAEIVEATGWLAHSARGLISGGLKKKLGFKITSQKEQGRGSVYRIG
ncbi:DUF3489 domain-containing protein [Roseinatronobacter sp.]|uniref:DUF3489 domain-containing protein n=1 Tax=Roseinatronobacter sp. TaxID=1945755 RepID=UPI0025D1382C|nr:DUF3489 domain-containing protein [Roseibaca sp.]